MIGANFLCALHGSDDNMFQFVLQSGVDTVSSVDVKRTIRSQAMKHFRKRQRDRIELNKLNGNPAHKYRRMNGIPMGKARPLLPAPCTDDTGLSISPAPSAMIKTQDVLDVETVSDIDKETASHGSKPRHSTPSTEGIEFSSEQSTLQSDEDLSPSNTLSAVMSKIPTPQLYREQVHSSFITSYYSNQVVSASHQFINTFHWLAPNSGAMNASRDALSLIHLGTRFQDQRMLNEGRKIHCEALRLIREEIKRPNAALDDCVLGACYTVAHCEVYKIISQNGLGWQSHMEGLYSLLQIRGSKSLTSLFAQAIFHNIRQIAAMDQLLKHKRTFLSSPDWLKTRSKAYVPAIELTNIALRISGALEDADKVVASPGYLGEEQIDIYLLPVRQLESELAQWLRDWSYHSAFEKAPCDTVSIAKFPQFEERCGDLAELVPQVYDFPNLLSATTQIYVWICLLALKISAADLSGLKPTASVYGNNSVIMEATECADHLCKSLAFLSSQQHRSSGILACSGPLYWAEKWYKRQNDSKMRQLCQRVRRSLESDSPTPLNLENPVLTWWMLPNIFVT